MVNKKVIKACRNIIDKHNEHTTLYELLEQEVADGLTFYEAEVVSMALDNYMAGCKYFFQGAGEETPHEITPYDVVKELQILATATKKNDTEYYQVTAVDRWGYEMGSDSNAEFFDGLLTCIKNGQPKVAFDRLNDDGDSGFDNVTYIDIATGKANNCSERIVYDDFTYIMTANADAITIYKRAEYREKEC